MGSPLDFSSGDFATIFSMCASLVSDTSQDLSAVVCRSTPAKKLGYTKGKISAGVVMFVACTLWLIFTTCKRDKGCCCYCRNNQVALEVQRQNFDNDIIEIVEESAEIMNAANPIILPH